MKYHLRLIKGLSFHGVVSATIKNPDVFTDNKYIADKAVSSGYFVLVDNAVNDNIFDTEEISAEEDISCLTVKELRNYAKEHKINVSHCENKADYINAIKEGNKNEV